MLSLIRQDVGKNEKKNGKALEQIEAADACLCIIKDDVLVSYLFEQTLPYVKRIDEKDPTLFDEVSQILATAAGKMDEQIGAGVIDIIGTVWDLLNTSTKKSLLTRLQVIGCLIRPDASERV